MKSKMTEKGISKVGAFGLPMPMAMVSMGNSNENFNIITVEMTGMLSVNPLTVYVSIRPERYSHKLISELRELVINFVPSELGYEMDCCGTHSGQSINKFEALKLTPIVGDKVQAPIIKESPVNYECTVKDILSLGSHDVFICQVIGVQCDAHLLDDKERLLLSSVKSLSAYEGFKYYEIGKIFESFGFSKKKNPS